MKKPNHEPCEDCKVRPATRIYANADGSVDLLCERCHQVRLLKEPIKDEDVLLYYEKS
jgi:hypothetical protein